ncbi:MAG TPA: ferric reductase-like transmembrane domain-containing protein [Solirubrobacterales bacterium]|nr:ferric reductase-like transmembrane domain-containing protein [Solirubrobacterales bacterium]
MTEAARTLESHGWWLASRASGVVALVLVTVSVAIGLAMAGKVLRAPGLSRKLMAIHEQTALAGLIAICVHAITLLGDPFLDPGVAGVTVPFALDFETFFTGLGVIAAYLALLLGLSFYARRRIGAKLWRRAHRATVLVYLLGLVHALGAGTDTSAVWFRWWVMATTPIVGGLFVHRVLEGRAKARAKAAKPQAQGAEPKPRTAKPAPSRPLAPRPAMEDG